MTCKVCGNCGNKYVSDEDAWLQTIEMRIWYGQYTQYSISPCCENPREQTKNELVKNIINDL